MRVKCDQCPDRTVDALLLQVTHSVQTNQQVVSIHISHIIAQCGQRKNHTGVLRGLCTMKLFLIINVCVYKFYHVLVIAFCIGDVAVSPLQTDDDPLSSGGINDDAILLCKIRQIITGGLVCGFHINCCGC